MHDIDEEDQNVAPLEHPGNDREGNPRDDGWAFLPDVRDGLTRAQRLVLYEIHKAQKETGRDFIPTVMLYGRVVEHINISEAELHAILRSLGVTGGASQPKTSRH